MIAAAHGPSALWYLSRGTGATTLVLLTASVVLGVGEIRLWRPAGAPRFAIATLHRTLSLLAVVLLAVHVVTTLLDPFPPIGLLAAVVPFSSSYRPLWLGFGTLASDLLLALVITSLARRRLGFRAWRGVHWLAYACWPVALVHGLGTGSDAKVTWMLTLTFACVAAVLVALVSRLAAPAAAPAARGLGAAGVTGLLVGLAVWLPAGPLASGWAKRAGTPKSVLAAFSPPVALRARARPRTPAVSDPLGRPFAAAVGGRIRNGVSAGGTAVAVLAMSLGGPPSGVLRVELGGQALSGGGLHMQRSAVTLGPPNDPRRYRGRIEFLNGTRLRALVGTADGRAVRLALNLSLGGDTVSGQVTGTPVGGSGA